jgi:hypothetical protein
MKATGTTKIMATITTITIITTNLYSCKGLTSDHYSV